MSTSHRYDDAYPPSLRNAEQKAVRLRRVAAGLGDHAAEATTDDAVGLALSGGGIRSATFALGLLQSLAKANLLRRVDFMSTVSGGGFIGAFLGRLFTRDAPDGGREQFREQLVERLAPNSVTRDAVMPDLVRQTLIQPASPPLQWLREHGRYLSPTGAGDTLIGVAVLMRNWIAVRLTLWSFFLAAFLAFNVVRTWLSFDGGFGGASYFWWSPSLAIVPPVVLLAIIPLAWSYWLFPLFERGGWGSYLGRGHVLIIAAALAGRRMGAVESGVSVAPWIGAFTIVFAIAYLTRWFTGRRQAEPAMHLLALLLFLGLITISAGEPENVRWLTRFFSPWRDPAAPPEFEFRGLLVNCGLMVFVALGLVAASRSPSAGGELFTWRAGRAMFLTALAASWVCFVYDVTRRLDPATPLLQGAAAEPLEHFIERFITYPNVVCFLAAAAFFRLAIPDRWLAGPERRWRQICDKAGLAATLVMATTAAIGLVASDVIDWPGNYFTMFCSFIALTAGFAALWLCLAFWIAGPLTGIEDEYDEVDYELNVEHTLTAWLRNSLILAGVVVVFALIDTCGQSLYVMFQKGNLRVIAAAAAVLAGGLQAALSASQNAAALLTGSGEAARIRPPRTLAALVIATPIILLELVSLNVASHAIAWGGDAPPTWSPLEGGDAVRMSTGWLLLGVGVAGTFAWFLSRSWGLVNRSTVNPLYAARLTRAYMGASNPRRWLAPFQAVTRVVQDDAIPTGRYEPHRYGGPLHLINVTVNETASGQSQIEQRDRKGLNLAFGPLGASVHVRHHALWQEEESHLPVSRFIELERDLVDLSVELDGVLTGLRAPPQVFPMALPQPVLDRVHTLGGAEAPAAVQHILQRLDEPVEIAAQFRRWTSAATALRTWIAESRQRRRLALRAIPLQAPPGPNEQFAVFEAAQDEFIIPCDDMPAALAISISGAAFSTGAGYRTSLGTSLLCGLLNIRLGYWWNSGVHPQNRQRHVGPRGLGWFERELSRSFPVQAALLQEFTARFHGPARRQWHLSDGGHYENMGAYELIRRRLPWIIVSDAEADPDYQFDGLGRLVSITRIDFGAEIEFLTTAELDAVLDASLRPSFGTLEQLRRGLWGDEPVNDPNMVPEAPRLHIDNARRNDALAHLSLAWIRYRKKDGAALDKVPDSILLYVKPTLQGDEPADVRHYHADHPDFPQETTANQYYNEAQWESYRKLGEHIGDLLCAPGDTNRRFDVPRTWLNGAARTLPRALYFRARPAEVLARRRGAPVVRVLSLNEDWCVTAYELLGDDYVVLENRTDHELPYDFHADWLPWFQKAIVVHRVLGVGVDAAHAINVGAEVQSSVRVPPRSTLMLRSRIPGMRRPRT